MVTICRNRLFLRLFFLLTSVFVIISFLTTLPFVSRSQLRPVMHFIDPIVIRQVTATPPPSENESDENELEEEWKLDEENIPELEIILGNQKGGPKHFKPDCAKFPNLFTVRFSNVHWQIQETEAEIYYLYAAYLDLRDSKTSQLKGSKASVRILGMSDEPELNLQNATLHLKSCQFWFKDRSKPEFGTITDCKRLWNRKWGRGHYYPYIITCQLPQHFTEVPASVSLAPHRCSNATNNLNIMHRDRLKNRKRIPAENTFGVCVKALDFPDGFMISRLVEWIEMLRSLGANKIFFYEFFVNPEIKKVLDFYEKNGAINVVQTTLPGELPNQPQIRHLYIRGKKVDKRLTELIPYNDCLYRNMYDYKYLAVVDTDEIIMPKNGLYSWKEMMNEVNRKEVGPVKLKKGPVTTYCFRNYYFLDGMMEGKESEVAHIPEEFHMLRHIYHSHNFTGYSYMKCFHNTEVTLGVHNHFAFYCRNNRCKRHYVSIKYAQMNHYRSTCVNEIKNCSLYLKETSLDKRIWLYKDDLIYKVNSVMQSIR